jgi:hypothetical protein
MSAPVDTLGEKLKELATGWTSYTAFGSFLLYVVGYLTLRFHLTALGVGTDLAVLDERYLFAGARFAVYLVSAVPIVVLLALLVLGVLYMPFRLIPESARANLRALWTKMQAHPVRLTVAGVIVSVLMIQGVMRQCFFYSNLLLAPSLPAAPAWLACLMRSDGLMSLFFSGLIAGTAIPGAVVFSLWDSPDERQSFKWLRALLAFLVAVQVLLLPVNYGVLIVDKSLARVTSVGAEHVGEGQQAWLVWEGKDGVTYLVHQTQGNTRSLVTVPRADAKKIEIIGYDRIVPVLVPEREGRGK